MIQFAAKSRWILVLALLSLGSGCHRAHYREQADAQAASLIRQKADHPHWALARDTIDIDPRSRMFDPFDPDFPPMPPDDPTSHQLMHRVDNKPGYPHWHRNGDTPFVENPDWMAFLPLDENGVLQLSADEAFQLALTNSPDYQEEFETLYLSALDVSSERFRFDPQYFGGYEAFYTTGGRLRTDAERSRLGLSLATNETGRLGLPAGGVRAPTAANLLVRKGFITGADLAAGFANSLIWDFGGPNDYFGVTLLDFSLIQPLLRQAGRDRIMEQLTLVERALLGNVRQMERFRRGFFVEIMTGVNAGQGATRRGGVFGGAGLEGFTGVGGGGFGQVGGGFGGGAANVFGDTGAGAGEVGGYLGLLQALQDIRNQQVTIVGLRSNLAQLRDTLRESLAQIPDDSETILREQLQIAQARQALLNAESRLLNSQSAYQRRLDFYKIDLGLPPTLCVNVNDGRVDAFNLIDPAILLVQDQLTRLRDSVAITNERLLTSALAGGDIPLADELRDDLQRLRQAVVQVEVILDQLTQNNLQQARVDIEQQRQSHPDRRQQLQQLQRKFEQEQDRFAEYGNLDPCQTQVLADIDPSVFDIQRLETAPDALEAELDRLESQFAAFREPLATIHRGLDELLADTTRPPTIDSQELESRFIFAVPSILSDLSDDVLDLSLIQARARTDTVNVTPIDLEMSAAVELARQFRRDWMNRRASLVDSWRLIEFNADNLESNLDIVVEGDLRNDGDNPLRLSSTNGRLRFGLRFDAPITRLQERNTYRQSLIEYEQARRGYYQFVDRLTGTLRDTIRSIDVNQVNFEERRIAVLSAIDQVVLNDQIQKLREERGLETGVTAARDVVSALADFQTAQNDFLSVWLNYEAQRLALDWNLGTMNLGPDGTWIDPGPIGGEYGYPQPMDWPAMPEILVDPGQDPYLVPFGSDGEGLMLPPEPMPVLEAATDDVIRSHFVDSLIRDFPATRPAAYQQPLRPLPLVR